MSKGPHFGDDELTKFLGPIGLANLLVTRAQVDMAAGRYYSFCLKSKILFINVGKLLSYTYNWLMFV